MSLDLTLAEHANTFAAHHDGWEDAAGVYAAASEPLFLTGLALLGLAGLLMHRRRLIVASALAVLAAGVGLAVGAVVSRVVDRPRPFAAHPHAIHAYLAHAADPGFPSDHAIAAFAIAAVLLLVLGLRTLPVLLAAVALAASRVLVGIHYPGDVLGGALLGCAAAAAVVLAARRWPPAGRATSASP
jgi:undecaprenyl-diphosphatase